SKSRIALFSPDSGHFVIVVERGIPESNEREFSLLLFRSDQAFRHPIPDRLVVMRSKSNRDGIRNVKWLDNTSLVFLGEAHGTSQVYFLDFQDKRLTRITSHPTPIVDFDFNPKVQEVV